jgi:hypothetical protein
MKNLLLAAAIIVFMTLPVFAMPDCPFKAAGTDIAVADTKDGVALTMTSKTGNVADLRRWAENMAKMHNAMPNEGMMREGMMPEGMMHGKMIPFSAKYEEVPAGALLSLTPKDPTRLEEFRVKVREHLESMKKTGECSMMDMMNGMMMEGMMGHKDAGSHESEHYGHER